MIKTLTNIRELPDHIKGLSVILFDLDDTLYAERSYVHSGFARVAEAVKDTIPDAMERMTQAFAEGKPAIDEMLKETGQESGDMKEKCLFVYRNQVPDIEPYPGVRETLRTLQEMGLRLGMITDGAVSRQLSKVDALNIRQYFDAILVTDALGGRTFWKPNPKAFEVMQKRFQVPFETMAYVGDNRAKDFTAPEELHMRSFYLENKDGLYQSGKPVRFPEQSAKEGE